MTPMPPRPSSRSIAQSPTLLGISLGGCPGPVAGEGAGGETGAGEPPKGAAAAKPGFWKVTFEPSPLGAIPNAGCAGVTNAGLSSVAVTSSEPEGANPPFPGEDANDPAAVAKGPACACGARSSARLGTSTGP